MKKQYVKTVWEVWSYDVWGGDEPGTYQVNNRFCEHRQLELSIPIEINNEGTLQEFLSAYPTDYQIRQALSLSRIRLSLDGDDTHIYIERERDGYPMGEMFCISHDSLSPIREGKTNLLK